jgi:hypothetical protein
MAPTSFPEIGGRAARTALSAASISACSRDVSQLMMGLADQETVASENASVFRFRPCRQLAVHFPPLLFAADPAPPVPCEWINRYDL